MAESVKKPKAEKAKAPAKTTKTANSKSKKSVAAAAPVSISSHAPSYEEVAALARKYWAEGGYREGHHEEDWFRAERDLRAKAS
ncbi:MAG: DUF2934 domain-containing protein [Acidobacteriota bacterium]